MIRRILASVRAVFSSPLNLIAFVAIYALLLASLYIFVSTREATLMQVLITYFFLFLIPAEFFILQAGILATAHRSRWQWRSILINAVKLFVVTVPIVIIGYIIWILLNKWQLRHLAPRPPIVFPPAVAKPQPMHWPSLLFATLRGLLFVVLIPLATIHLWIEVAAHDARAVFPGGAAATARRFGQALARTLSAPSVAIYAIGLILFALIPYFLIVFHPSPKGTKTDFAVFVLRLLLVFVFTLFGWIVTLFALSSPDETERVIAPAQPAVAAEAAA